MSSYKIFSGVASIQWAFSTKFWLFLGGSIQWNTTKNFYKNSFNPSLYYTLCFKREQMILRIVHYDKVMIDRYELWMDKNFESQNSIFTSIF